MSLDQLYIIQCQYIYIFTSYILYNALIFRYCKEKVGRRKEAQSRSGKIHRTSETTCAQKRAGTQKTTSLQHEMLCLMYAQNP